VSKTDEQDARRVPKRLAGIGGWTDYSWIDRIGHVRLQTHHEIPKFTQNQSRAGRLNTGPISSQGDHQGQLVLTSISCCI
jgi:hypothetical protein